jgi:hypothetical protein
MHSEIPQDSSSLETARSRLLRHPLYGMLDRREHIQIFMKHHVFAVWDFFSLLKRLQREVTCVSVPWRPRGLGDHARFITEILIAEECDEGMKSSHLSHFELYLDAMREMDADRGPIEGYIARLEAGADPVDALESTDIPPTVRCFTGQTLRTALSGELHQVAASFCHGRETLLADVFSSTRANMSQALADGPIFRHYLERHITLDHDEHGPLALNLLEVACAGDAGRLAEAESAGVEALGARSALWDGVLQEIQEHDLRDAEANGGLR